MPVPAPMTDIDSVMVMVNVLELTLTKFHNSTFLGNKQRLTRGSYKFMLPYRCRLMCNLD